MINIGCVSTHPDDASFFSSETTRRWLGRNPHWKIHKISDLSDAASVDVLLLDVHDLNKYSPAPELGKRTWILMSSQKADAYQAWQQQAAFFLLRPLTIATLDRALNRATLLHYSITGIMPPKDQRMLDLQITKGRRLPVSCQDILYLEAQGELTLVYLDLPDQRKITATRNLGFWEDQLEGCDFVRAHKKFLVNIARISDLSSDEIRVGEYLVPVAKRRRREVEQLILRFRRMHHYALPGLSGGH
ncbi:MAG: LytTR family transcriptional regulator [Bacteroidetes bacterium]|nr:MAG: LytTR family transcriptional regulator [Bacteroidota bacterium]